MINVHHLLHYRQFGQQWTPIIAIIMTHYFYYRKWPPTKQKWQYVIWSGLVSQFCDFSKKMKVISSYLSHDFLQLLGCVKMGSVVLPYPKNKMNICLLTIPGAGHRTYHSWSPRHQSPQPPTTESIHIRPFQLFSFSSPISVRLVVHHNHHYILSQIPTYIFYVFM